MTHTMARTSFKQRLQSAPAVLAPGVYDAFTALVAAQAGFEALYLSGASIAYTRLGRSDVGLTTATEVADTLARITERVSLPVIVDGDTGFGNAVNVHYTVGELLRTGVAGMQIEDQESPKKSGTLAGRRCIPLDEAVGKIRAAVEARDELDPSFVICARCDELGAEGGTFESTLAR